MVGLREMKDKGYIPQSTYLKMMMGGALSLSKTLLFNMRDLKKLRVLPSDAERYVRPKREYEIPEFKKSMKYCKSNERYLRPTLYCDPSEPEVVALANKLVSLANHPSKVLLEKFATKALQFTQ